MATDLHRFRLEFPDGYDERSEFETPLKGYLRDVVVHLENGSRYKLFFMDPVRLRQDLEEEVKTGRGYYAEPGMVILPEVTSETIRMAVPGLRREGFFHQLKPLQGRGGPVEIGK